MGGGKAAPRGQGGDRTVPCPWLDCLDWCDHLLCRPSPTQVGLHLSSRPRIGLDSVFFRYPYKRTVNSFESIAFHSAGLGEQGSDILIASAKYGRGSPFRQPGICDPTPWKTASNDRRTASVLPSGYSVPHFSSQAKKTEAVAV